MQKELVSQKKYEFEKINQVLNSHQKNRILKQCQVSYQSHNRKMRFSIYKFGNKSEYFPLQIIKPEALIILNWKFSNEQCTKGHSLYRRHVCSFFFIKNSFSNLIMGVLNVFLSLFVFNPLILKETYSAKSTSLQTPFLGDLDREIVWIKIKNS